MNNLTKAYEENTAFKSLVDSLAIWLKVYPIEHSRIIGVADWLLAEPIDEERSGSDNDEI